MITLTESTFDEALAAYRGLLVDFWAPWCAPCRAVAPLLEGLEHEYDGHVMFGKVNVDEQPALAARFGVRAIPTLILFKDGDVAERAVGALPSAEIRARLDRLR